MMECVPTVSTDKGGGGLMMEAVCQNGEDRDQQNVLGTSGQKAAQKLLIELQAAGLAAPLCAVP
jgi:hypothetical protein